VKFHEVKFHDNYYNFERSFFLVKETIEEEEEEEPE